MSIPVAMYSIFTLEYIHWIIFYHAKCIYRWFYILSMLLYISQECCFLILLLYISFVIFSFRKVKLYHLHYILSVYVYISNKLFSSPYVISFLNLVFYIIELNLSYKLNSFYTTVYFSHSNFYLINLNSYNIYNFSHN